MNQRQPNLILPGRRDSRRADQEEAIRAVIFPEFPFLISIQLNITGGRGMKGPFVSQPISKIITHEHKTIIITIMGGAGEFIKATATAPITLERQHLNSSARATFTCVVASTPGFEDSRLASLRREVA